MVEAARRLGPPKPGTPGPDYAALRPWPLARLGYLYATAVGFIWGSIWSTGRVERIEGLELIGY